MIADKKWRCNDNFSLLEFLIFYFYKLYKNKKNETITRKAYAAEAANHLLITVKRVVIMAKTMDLNYPYITEPIFYPSMESSNIFPEK